MNCPIPKVFVSDTCPEGTLEFNDDCYYVPPNRDTHIRIPTTPVCFTWVADLQASTVRRKEYSHISYGEILLIIISLELKKSNVIISHLHYKL